MFYDHVVDDIFQWQLDAAQRILRATMATASFLSFNVTVTMTVAIGQTNTAAAVPVSDIYLFI